MHSYMILAVLALATSAVSPALSAPIQHRYVIYLLSLKAGPS
jgi:hypothetical protein